MTDMSKNWTIEKQRESNRKSYYKHKEKRLKEANKYHHKLRVEVLSKYSDNKLCCACCDENILEFLAIDHINGGGTSHRKEVGNSYRMYRWLKNNNYPDGFRVLCHNCNQATSHGRICPHELLEEKL